MGSKFFYGMFAFTLAFLLGLVVYWSVNKQYVSNSQYHQCPNSQNHQCPKYNAVNQNSNINYRK